MWTSLTHVLVDPELAKSALTIALNRLIAAEPDITNYDTIVGDGDCGIGLKRGAEGQCFHKYEASRADQLQRF